MNTTYFAYFLLLYSMVPSFSFAQGYADSSWPMFGQNPQHTFRAVDAPPATSEIKWKFQADEGQILTSLAIGSDGTLYAGTAVYAATPELPCHFYSINPDGTLNWKFEMSPRRRTTAPAIGSDGTIYFGSEDYKVYALNSNGSLRWKYETGYAIYAPPVIGENGTLYVASGDRYLYAFSPVGEVKWKLYIQYGRAFVIGNDGTLYSSTRDESGEILCAINPQGELLWKTPIYDDIESFSIGNNGTIYAALSRHIMAVSPDGTVLWQQLTPTNIKNSLSLGHDDTIYYGQKDGNFNALHPDGTLKWSFFRDKYVFDTATIGSDGCIYVCGHYSLRIILYAINPDGSLKWETLLNPGGSVYSSPVIGSDGTLYITADEIITEKPASSKWDSYIYAFAPERTTSADAQPQPIPTISVHPNPFNPVTTLSYTLPSASHVQLSVYAVNGQKVADLVNGSMTAGTHSALFDGSGLASGLYFYKFRAHGILKTGKITLMK